MQNNIPKKDYYKILGISRNASQSEIKKAIKDLSLRNHPDRNKSPEAEKIIRDVNEAKRVLTDETLKRNYDQHGLCDGQENKIPDTSDIPNMFKRTFCKPKETEQKEQIIPINVTFDNLCNGFVKTLKINIKDMCKPCSGTGCLSKMKTTCVKCGGKGSVQQPIQMGPIKILGNYTPCSNCKERGFISLNECNHCKGEGIVKSSITRKLTFNENTNFYNNVKLDGLGDFIPKYGKKQDLYIKFNIFELGNYKILNEFDIILTKKVNINEALSGYTLYIDKFLDNKSYKLKINEVIKDNDLFYCENLGVPKGKNKGRGKFIVLFKYIYPSKILNAENLNEFSTVQELRKNTTEFISMNLIRYTEKINNSTDMEDDATNKCTTQ
jgi:molecular chaperone DnaJ